MTRRYTTKDDRTVEVRPCHEKLCENGRVYWYSSNSGKSDPCSLCNGTGEVHYYL